MMGLPAWRGSTLATSFPRGENHRGSHRSRGHSTPWPFPAGGGKISEHVGLFRCWTDMPAPPPVLKSAGNWALCPQAGTSNPAYPCDVNRLQHRAPRSMPRLGAVNQAYSGSLSIYRGAFLSGADDAVGVWRGPGRRSRTSPPQEKSRVSQISRIRELGRRPILPPFPFEQPCQRFRNLGCARAQASRLPEWPQPSGRWSQTRSRPHSSPRVPVAIPQVPIFSCAARP